MTALAPDHRERRGDSVLLVWGDLPWWTVVDCDADRFIARLVEGESPAKALDRLSHRTGIERDAASVVQALKRAGVIGRKRNRAPKTRIESISVNVTNRCNLNCTFCYNRDHEDHGNELSSDEMIEALEGIRRWTVRGAPLAMLGGEPLMAPERTLALGEWARKRGMTPILSTNGTLVTAEFARRAAEIGIECQVSIDGAKAETHDAVRGEGTFERAVEGVGMFRDAGAHTIISMVFHAENVGEIPDYLRMARELSVDEARFIPVKALAGGGDFRLPDLAEVVRTITDLVSAEPDLGSLLGRDYVSILAQTCRSCALRQGCGTASQTLLLDADGTVYPCINLSQPEMAFGNIREQSLRQIWQGGGRLAEIREAVALESRERCRECWARYWCMGGCRGETYANTGKLDAPSVTCAQNRTAIIETFWAVSRCPELFREGPQYC
ncbi:MAG: radical SAM protein [Armatimonadota bacterium]